jgi:3-oxoadipate enol-lactonase
LDILNVKTGHFRVADQGPRNAPVLMFSNSLGTPLELWDGQAAALSDRFRVVRYDTRGHGSSCVTPGPYSIGQLADDVVQILDALDIARVTFCGISMGGITGLALATEQPARIARLVVANSAAKIGEADTWHDRAAQVRAGGAEAMSQLAATAPERWFTPAYVQNHPNVVQRAQAWVANADPQGYAACCEALAQADWRARLGEIAVPSLFIAGEADPVTTVAHAQAMQSGVPGASLAVLRASHLSNLEAEADFTNHLAAFLTDSP